MSRKDTIIIAVLVNAALLVVLLTTALKKDDGMDSLVIQESNTPVTTEMGAAPVEGLPVDEVDQVLTHYTNNPPAPAANFVQDLQAIATPPPVTHPPVVAATPIPTPAKETFEVKVKKGDVLEKIARAQGTTVEEIMKLNKLTSTHLKIGQVLQVRSGKSLPAVETAPPAVKFYTVKNGDNPWTIAVKNHMKVDELLKLNNLNDEKARRLKPGDKLKIK